MTEGTFTLHRADEARVEMKQTTVLFVFWIGVALAGGILLSACAGPQEKSVSAANPAATAQTGLEGAWKLQANQSLLPDGKLVPRHTYESLWLFTRKHYSITYARGDQPRVPFEDPARRTLEEKAAAFDSIVMNAGTYELKGSTLITHPIVARLQSFAGGRAEFECRIEGASMFLQRRHSFSADGKPYQEEGHEYTFVLKRVE